MVVLKLASDFLEFSMNSKKKVLGAENGSFVSNLVEGSQFFFKFL